MILYSNDVVNIEGCPGCAYGNHEFELPCQMAYEDANFTLSQDWELPIVGFFVVSPKRHVEKLSELTEEERTEMFSLVNKTVIILRESGICDRFEYVFEEKENRHFHVWIMPRYEWMKDVSHSIIGNINDIFAYAKANLRSDNTNQEINKVTDIVRTRLKK